MKRRDDNHTEIVAALERLGWSVIDTSNLGNGIPDLLIGDRAHGLFLVEVKNKTNWYGRAGLTKSQKAFAERWTACHVHVVGSVEDAEALTRQITGGDSADGLRPVVEVAVVESATDVAAIESGAIPTKLVEL